MKDSGFTEAERFVFLDNAKVEAHNKRYAPIALVTPRTKRRYS